MCLVAALLPPKTKVVRKCTHVEVISRTKMSRTLVLEYLQEVAAMDFRIYTAELLKKLQKDKNIF